MYKINNKVKPYRGGKCMLQTIDKRFHYSKDFKNLYTFDDIIGTSPVLNQAIQVTKHVSKADFNVLLSGESGTGKELFAQAIHSQSRPNGPFVAVNCASIPKSLIESELFGYEGGAFTGAERGGRLGKIEAANGGTLFLDEIGDMPLEVQPTLLRVLEDKKVLRLGSNKYTPVNFRLITATNKDLYQMVKEKLFRDDLYFRLSIFKINIPSLRDRGKDEILFLSRYFIAKISHQIKCKPPKLCPEVYDKLTEYNWPGNVRQLENAMIYAVYMAQNGLIKIDNLPDDLKNNYPITSEHNKKKFLSLNEIEKKAIEDVMIYTENDKNEAVRILGISKSTLYRKLKKYGFED